MRVTRKSIADLSDGDIQVKSHTVGIAARVPDEQILVARAPRGGRKKTKAVAKPKTKKKSKTSKKVKNAKKTKKAKKGKKSKGKTSCDLKSKGKGKGKDKKGLQARNSDDDAESCELDGPTENYKMLSAAAQKKGANVEDMEGAHLWLFDSNPKNRGSHVRLIHGRVGVNGTLRWTRLSICPRFKTERSFTFFFVYPYSYFNQADFVPPPLTNYRKDIDAGYGELISTYQASEIEIVDWWKRNFSGKCTFRGKPRYKVGTERGYGTPQFKVVWIYIGSAKEQYWSIHRFLAKGTMFDLLHAQY